MSTFSRARNATAATLTLPLLLTACSTAGGETAADAGPPKPGGTLRLGISSNPDCLDPQQISTNASINVGRQLVDSLTWRKSGRATPIPPRSPSTFAPARSSPTAPRSTPPR